MLLKVLLGGGNELDGSELEATVLEARDDGSDEATLKAGVSMLCSVAVQCRGEAEKGASAPERHQA